MIKKSQLFGWEHEPVSERPSAVASTSLSRPVTTTTARPSVTAGEFQRDPPNVRDQTLSPLAVSWLNALPDEAKPNALCKRFPRVANRLALCWADPSLAGHVFDHLVAGKRGGRKGFPSDVAQELTRLAALMGKRS